MKSTIGASQSATSRLPVAKSSSVDQVASDIAYLVNEISIDPVISFDDVGLRPPSNFAASSSLIPFRLTACPPC